MTNRPLKACTAVALVTVALLVSAALLYPITLLLASPESVKNKLSAGEPSLMLISAPSVASSATVSQDSNKQKINNKQAKPAKTKPKKKTLSAKKTNKPAIIPSPNKVKSSIQAEAKQDINKPQNQSKTELPAEAQKPEKEENNKIREPSQVAVEQAELDTKANEKTPRAAAESEPIKRRPIQRVEPKYPKKARRRGVEGSVVLQFKITSEGKASEIQVIEATPPGYFEKSAIKALKKWHYPRSTSQDKANSLQRISMQFKLH